MSLFVDTSVWPLALRRDAEHSAPQVAALRDALRAADQVFTAGLVPRGLLEPSPGPRREIGSSSHLQPYVFTGYATKQVA